MKDTHKNFLALIAITVLISAAVFIWAGHETPPQDLPPVTFTDLEGKPHTLAEFRGKPVILHFWASWCAPCVKEFPSLVKAQQDNAAKGLVILPVSVDTDASAIRTFYQSHGITGFPIYRDPQYAAFHALGLAGVPQSIFINAEGKEIGRMHGGVDWQGFSAGYMIQKAMMVGK